MKSRTLHFLIGLACLVPFLVSAQAPPHPRVAQLEKNLAREGLDLLKGRFPDKPFLIKVRIYPLFREKQKRERGEQLPYLDLADEEILDEWDDPVMSSTALIGRVKQIHLSASVPSNLSEDELTELKDTLMSNLAMVPGRDTVEINKRNWGSQDQEIGVSRSMILWTVVGWVLFSVALLGVAWFTTSRLGRTLKAGQKADAKGSPSGPQMQTQMLPEARKENLSSQSTGDIRFSDPIKNRELITANLWVLGNHKGFPNLEDMMILHKFAETDPRGLGALLSEFPIELRSRVFRYSFGDSWLVGLSDPGEINSKCLEVLNKCARVQRNESELEVEELKTLVWRLESKSADFFRGIDQS